MYPLSPGTLFPLTGCANVEPLNRLRFICSSVIFLQALDLATTALGLASGGLERNPLVAHFGWTPLVLLKFACVLGLSALPFLILVMPLEKRPKFVKQSTVALGGLAIFYVIVVASNLAVAA